MAGGASSSPVSPIPAITGSNSHDDSNSPFQPARRRLSPSPSPSSSLLPCFSVSKQEGVPRRPFCKRCWKPEKLCICQRFPDRAVDSKVRVVILQHPEERNHPVGSARVALLGIKNLSLIALPESPLPASVRNRPKVPGSKRSARGRSGGKGRRNRPGARLQNGIDLEDGIAAPENGNGIDVENGISPGNGSVCAEDGTNPENGICTGNGIRTQNGELETQNGSRWMNGVTEKLSALCLAEATESPPADNGSPSSTSDRVCKAEKGNYVAIANGDIELGILLQDLLFAKDGTIAENLEVKKIGTLLCPEILYKVALKAGIGLLFPSERAIELSRDADNSLTHLIVLDGTWSKAKRLLFENPWLQALPHYKLPGLFSSIYEGVRKAPKPGCLSTLESIVYALKILEPETEGLDELLRVFDSMVDDQRKFKEIKLLKRRPIGIDETKV